MQSHWLPDVVFLTIVIYRLLCHVIGLQMIYRESCKIERVFCTLHSFLLLYHHLPGTSSSTSKFVWNHTAIHKYFVQKWTFSLLHITEGRTEEVADTEAEASVNTCDASKARIKNFDTFIISCAWFTLASLFSYYGTGRQCSQDDNFMKNRNWR